MPRPSFSRDEAAQILSLPTTAVRAVSSEASVSADRLEGFLRDALLSLYRAEAARPVVEELPEETIDLDTVPDITHSLAEFETGRVEERANLRVAPRYTPRKQLGGTFRQVRFTIMQLSTTGLRIRHDDTLRPGEVARLAFSIINPARTFSVQARVVWTSIAQRGDGRSFCISGLRITEGVEQVHQAIDILREHRELQLVEEEPAPRRAQATSPMALTGLSDDEVAEIIRAVRRLGSDPVEANRWYTRARFALADEAVREAAPVRARDREEVIGVWEYLQRRLDIKKVAGVVLWLRQTRSSGATAS